MAVYDHQEREQIEDIKAWWAQWGAYVTAVAVLAVVILAGTTAWRQWQAQKHDAASVLYFEVADAEQSKNEAKAATAMNQLVSGYAGTAYAPRAALLYAKLLWDAGKEEEAQAQLKWVIDNASESALKDIARYRLASTEVDRNHYEGALKLLSTPPHEAFTPLFADLRGDALLAQNQVKEAIAAYTLALSKAPQDGGGSRFFSVLLSKLDHAQSLLDEPKPETKSDAPASPVVAADPPQAATPEQKPAESR
ncbi:MAG: tetratricopeptide repeat protein [Burkholderiales bacterium]|jgi:predicted negative regulator of RcsB-dependent stress response|nr:tetratricopeptide repeat protein [Burkholderiales bacterium]